MDGMDRSLFPGDFVDAKAQNRHHQRMSLQLQEGGRTSATPGEADANADALFRQEWVESAAETSAINLKAGESAVKNVGGTHHLK